MAEVEQMGSSELSEWMQFWSIEPWGPYRDNIHTGLIAATIANVYRKKNSPALTYEDFMLLDKDEHKKRESRKTLNWMKAVARRKNG